MNYKNYSNIDLIKELKKVRLALDVIINEHIRELLIEVERRLKGEEPLQPSTNIKKKGYQGERITKESIKLRLLKGKGK